MNIKFTDRFLSSERYFRETYEKKQIYLHHTVSGKGVDGDINWLNTSPQVGVAVPIIIDRLGTRYRLFDIWLWAHHLGIPPLVFKRNGFPNDRNLILNKESIAIELDRWGGLIKDVNQQWRVPIWDTKLRKYVPHPKVAPIPKEQVVEYKTGWRGFFAYEKYTNAQIKCLEETLLWLHQEFPTISLSYNSDMWDLSKAALNSNTGIWAHVSVRPDKSDVHPQWELTQMLKNISKINLP